MTDAMMFTQKLGGSWFGRFGTAPCPVCQMETRKDQNALTVSQGQSGLLLHCKKSACAFFDVLQAAKEVLGASSLILQTHPATMRPNLQNIEKSVFAEKIWKIALPIEGTKAEAYLRSRGIKVALPAVLRYSPECRHPSREIYPAMIAQIEGGEGSAVHRTYLAQSGVGKVLAEPQKAMLGQVSGGAVRLSEGAGPLVVAEGIESSLSLLCGLLNHSARVWAALSTSGIRGLRLPSNAGELIVAADGDAAGQSAAFALASRASALGWIVSFMNPPEGMDWNDVLQSKGGAA